MGRQLGLLAGADVVVPWRNRCPVAGSARAESSDGSLPESASRPGCRTAHLVGLRVELGEHVFDQWGYMAGRDEDRVFDLNAAFRDPGVRAVIAARGGKGAYRIVDDLDTDALRRDPKPVVGFSDITHLHLAVWSRCRLAGLHGPFAKSRDTYTGPASAESLRRALMTTDPVNPASRRVRGHRGPSPWTARPRAS
ncbi:MULTISPECIES: LD-carboxypeptidase [unclassified Streptomyces]|uniref:LD-carboxypeptidase n=1 Tax=unclassified Streptomyces TaxID=2593676 RepID=UPI0036E7D8CD